MRRKRRAIAIVVPAIVVLAGFLVLALCRHARLFTVTVLPRLGVEVVVPCAINDHGQIVGVCRGRCYLWERGRDWREVGEASYVDINNASQIAGTTEDPNGSSHAFLWDPNDGLIPLGTGTSMAQALNNRGQVVGRCWKASGGGRVFLWDKPHGMRVLAKADGSPQAMNDLGQIIACRGEMMPLQAVFWEPAEDGSVTETLLPSGAFCDLNNRGYVLGSGFNFDERKHCAFLWHQDQGVEWLFPLENLMARVVALNDANQVAVCGETHRGWLDKLTKRRLRPYKESFLWTREKGRVVLDGYVLDRQGEYFNITGLNNVGCIVGSVVGRGGSVRRAVLLEPIPGRWRK